MCLVKSKNERINAISKKKNKAIGVNSVLSIGDRNDKFLQFVLQQQRMCCNNPKNKKSNRE